MTFLLDTHCWLWLKADSRRLSSPVRRRVLRNPRALVLSSVCVMEIVIKQATGKLTLGAGGAQQFVAELIDEGVATLDAGVEHMLRMGLLPPRHRDPFDRLLVAQALVGGFVVVTPDEPIRQYPVRTLW
jgi:PIN domain nuclease of toxin-antitoxin system